MYFRLNNIMCIICMEVVFLVLQNSTFKNLETICRMSQILFGSFIVSVFIYFWVFIRFGDRLEGAFGIFITRPTLQGNDW